MRWVLVLLFAISTASPSMVVAEELPERYPYRNDERLSNCSFYRSKKADIPVYGQAETSAKVVGHLGLGEEVCYIGERQEFAILDWSKQHIIRASKIPFEPVEAFVRLVDLWEPRVRPASKDSLLDRMRAFYEMRRSGVVPEDPLGPFRPMIEETSEGSPTR